ncbi:hypothetical protein [Streptomyces iakyrus]|uniref:hypothetical protein n=1 Tax=Streptomyces iakyrus TaxID=68219 RepID=UPI003D9012B1
MSRDSLVDPEFTNHYTDTLHKVIEAKQEGRPATVPELRPGRGQRVDLMAALLEESDGQGPACARRERLGSMNSARPPPTCLDVPHATTGSLRTGHIAGVEDREQSEFRGVAEEAPRR